MIEAQTFLPYSVIIVFISYNKNALRLLPEILAGFFKFYDDTFRRIAFIFGNGSAW